MNGLFDLTPALGTEEPVTVRPASPSTGYLIPAPPAALFDRAELVQAEALRQHKAAQLPGQVDIWDACAEVAAEAAEQPFAWPEPVGALYARDDVTGAAVLS